MLGQMKFGARRGVLFLVGGALLWLLCIGVAWLRVGLNSDGSSHQTGRPGQGRIASAKSVPPSGKGYESYSYLGAALGRQYVHSAVLSTLQDAFSSASAKQPGRVFQLAETGWRTGGRFRPHRTHQNGLSVDIFMPVDDEAGRTAQLSTWPWRLFGYGWDFDATGRSSGLQIRFDTLGDLLLALTEAGAKQGLRIELVIVAPEYIPLLFATPAGPRLEPLRSRFLRRAWIRHDEHVHVDFALVADRRSDD